MPQTRLKFEDCDQNALGAAALTALPSIRHVKGEKTKNGNRSRRREHSVTVESCVPIIIIIIVVVVIIIKTPDILGLEDEAVKACCR
nr:hypothetical protein BaRGS_034393 [Batillaria attramentaria]